MVTFELVTITPAQRDQAPLTITFTSFPGLYLRAGAWQDFALPACGCDACEEDAEYVLRELAEYAEALTAGLESPRNDDAVGGGRDGIARSAGATAGRWPLAAVVTTPLTSSRPRDKQSAPVSGELVERV
ncbi:DUF6226 family protein [Rhodococcus sp. NM-2]|uniref:DUF6226 family protein n=1 Tax=Rhodococcus sp. NM-2 TaxID=3401174 RepID=UPI003AAA43CF